MSSCGWPNLRDFVRRDDAEAEAVIKELPNTDQAFKILLKLSGFVRAGGKLEEAVVVKLGETDVTRDQWFDVFYSSNTFGGSRIKIFALKKIFELNPTLDELRHLLMAVSNLERNKCDGMHVSLVDFTSTYDVAIIEDMIVEKMSERDVTFGEWLVVLLCVSPKSSAEEFVVDQILDTNPTFYQLLEYLVYAPYNRRIAEDVFIKKLSKMDLTFDQWFEVVISRPLENRVKTFAVKRILSTNPTFDQLLKLLNCVPHKSNLWYCVVDKMSEVAHTLDQLCYVLKFATGKAEDVVIKKIVKLYK